MSDSVNVFNPQGIAAGDVVRLSDINRDGLDNPGEMVVQSVGGRNGNKVFCREVGHELYASCFTLVRKQAEDRGELS